MTLHKRLRMRLKEEYKRKDIQSTGLFTTALVDVRLRMQEALAQPAPYLANNVKLVEQLLETHRFHAERHVAMAVSVQGRRKAS